MKRWIGLSASTVLGPALAGAAAVWTRAPFFDSAQMLSLFRNVSISAIPAAAYFAILLGDHLRARAEDQGGAARLVLEAHVLGLALAGLLLLMVLGLAGMASGISWELFVTAAAASAAGGSGLAWGAVAGLRETI